MYEAPTAGDCISQSWGQFCIRRLQTFDQPVKYVAFADTNNVVQ